jgi:hypothetical protein
VAHQRAHHTRALLNGASAALWLAVLLALAVGGCGRIGYEAVEIGGVGAGADAAEARDTAGEMGQRDAAGATDAGGAVDSASGGGGSDAVLGGGADGAADVSPGPAPADAGPGAGFVLGAAAPTAVAGSPASGTPYVDPCPPGEVVIGYLGTTSRSPVMPWLQAIQTRCGRVTVGPAPAYTTATAAGTVLPARGLQSGDAWAAPCPANQVVVGFEGRSSDWVAQLTFHCAPLQVTATGSGYSVTVGSVAKAGPAGSNAGSPFAPIACPAGHIATGTSVRTDTYPRAFSLLCAPLTFAP